MTTTTSNKSRMTPRLRASIEKSMEAQLGLPAGGRLTIPSAGADRVRLQVEVITPEKALSILEGMPENRRVREPHVRMLASDMENGKWYVNAETVKFDPDGNLVDGQHRLWACVLSGKPFTTCVAYNVTIDGVDANAPRFAADHWGGSDARTVQAICNSIMSISHWGRRKFSTDELTQCRDRLSAEVLFVKDWARQQRAPREFRTAKAYAGFALAMVDHPRATRRIMEALTQLDFEEPCVRAMFRWARSNQLSSLSVNQVAGMIRTAVKANEAGRSLQILRAVKGDWAAAVAVARDALGVVVPQSEAAE